MINELVDLSECKFIDNEMKYYTYIDFCNNCKAIKRMYKELSKNGKLFYKWYVYANIHMELNYKNKIWDYLNDYYPEEKLIFSMKFYRIK